MSFLDVFKAKNTEISQETALDDVLLRAVLNRETITRDKAMDIPAVSAAVDLISSTFAMVPIKLYKVSESNGNRRVEEIKDNRTRLLNTETGDTLNGFQFKKALCEDYLLGKGGYAYIRRRGNEVVSLHYVKEENVAILKNDDPIFKRYEIVVNAKRYQDYEFIKLLRSSRDGAEGTPILREVSEALATAYAMLKFQYQQMAKGGNRKGFLQSEKAIGKDEIKALKDAWNNLYSNNTENVAVLNNGVTFKESQNSSVELQLNQSKITLARELDNIFHIKEDYKAFIREAVMPICTECATALNNVLLLEKEKKRLFFEHDFSEILKADVKERFEAYQTAKEAGWITVNEIRRKENMERIDGMDVVNVGLSAVLYDIDTGKYIIPNMGKVVDLEEMEEADPQPEDPEEDPAEPEEDDTTTGGSE